MNLEKVNVSAVEQAHHFELLLKQSDILAKSTIIPSAYRNKPNDIIAAGLAGRAFNWDVMMSLRNFHVIEGTASLRPEAMLGLVRQAGHSVQVEIINSAATVAGGKSARAVGKRADTGDEHISVFSRLDAKAAGLANKRNWQQYEDAMLTWRSVGALCRVLFPDVVLGAGYVPEELGAQVDDQGEVIDDPFAIEFVACAVAKKQLLEACNGDKDLARSLWGDLGSVDISQDELDDILDIAKKNISAQSLQMAEVALIVDQDDEDLARRIQFFSETNKETEQ